MNGNQESSGRRCSDAENTGIVSYLSESGRYLQRLYGKWGLAKQLKITPGSGHPEIITVNREICVGTM